MTSRERWTVYPLLLLAIGLAVRGAVAPPDRLDQMRIDTLEARHVFCEGLVVTGSDGRDLVHVGRVVRGGGGRIEIRDADGIDAIAIGTRPDDRRGVVEFFDERGEPAGRLTADSATDE